MHRRIAAFLIGTVLLAPLATVAFAGERQVTKPRPRFESEKIRVSKKTTYLLGPLRKDGTVDFAAALDARASKGITAENNAAVLVAQVVSREELSSKVQKLLYRKLGIPKSVKPQPRLLSHWEFARKMAGEKQESFGRKLLKQQEASRKRLWSRNEMPELAAWLKLNRQPLKVVRTAVWRSRWYSPILLPGKEKIDQALMFSLLPLAQSARDFGRALAASATLAVREGRDDEAFNCLRDCRQLARLVVSSHSLVEHLVGRSIEEFANEATVAILQSGKLTAKQLARLAKDFEGLKPMPSCAEKINTFERLAVIDAVIHIRRDGYSSLRLLSSISAIGDWGGKLGWAVFSFLVDWNRVLEIINENFDRAYSAVKTEPYRKRKAAIEAFQERRARSRQRIPLSTDELYWRFFGWGQFNWTVFTQVAGDLVTGLLMPAFTQARISDDRLHAQSELVPVAVSLERYRNSHGRFPSKLADLRPRYLKAIPIDHFAQKPFHYKRLKGGYLLYSVGPNMKDENGKSPDPNSRFSSGDDPDDIALRVRVPK